MRVLVAIEDEQFAPLIMEFVLTHEWQTGSILKLISVVEPSVVGDNITAIYGGGIDRQILEERVNKASKELNELREELHSKLGDAIPVEVNVMVGQPHHAIIEVADAWKADMIVMGSHGRKGFSRFLLGSVSLFVVSHANCSVTIVRPGEHADMTKVESTAAKADVRAGTVG